MSSDEEMAGHADPWTSSLEVSPYIMDKLVLAQGNMLDLFDSQIEYQKFAWVKAYKSSLVLMHR